MADEKKTYSMELPMALIERVDEVAKANHRSRQGEIAVAIESHVKRENRKRGA